MTSTQIRQSFLDFFKSKSHTIVPSSSLMPDSPNLLFTNAGMNQFVPIFLGQKNPDVKSWAGAIPGKNTRAADTQKCIRAGGKHNDLDDVGLDTYHHTFFEMLGNWSFGDYFKKEAIDWAWELVIKGWEFPADRVYATVFCPYLGEPGWEKKWQMEMEQVLTLAMTSPDFIAPDPDASPFEVADQEAAMYWAKKFQTVGRDPKVHIIPGNKKDNFWMMGETGPCGPCSELHVDLTPEGNTRGSLVNKGDARCIEIWNLVFIQFNAEPDGPEEAAKMALPNAKGGETWRQRFVPLPAKHVDTGMGFERVTSIIQGTRGFRDFANAKISNYETDIFRPIFDAIEKLSGKRYGSTLPKAGSTGDTEQEKADVAFRVIADHIRTLSFAIADNIEPGIKGRNGVLRSIHKRMVRYASTIDVEGEILLGTQDALVETVAMTMGDVFPEVRARKEHIKNVLRREADVFNKTLDNGIAIFEGSLFELSKLKEFLKEVPSRLTSVRSELDSIPDAFPISVEYLESAWARFGIEVADVPTDRKFHQALQEDLEKQSTVGVFSKLATLAWHGKHWKAFCKAANSQYEALQDLGNSPKEFEECRARIRQELKELESNLSLAAQTLDVFPGDVAFKLHDTYGFPLDLTELMARERGLTVGRDSYFKDLEQQQERSRAAQKKEVISVSQVETTTPTKFVGFDTLETDAKVVEVLSLKDKTAVVLDTSVCYAEMGGQVGDTGELHLYPAEAVPDSTASTRRLRITNTQKSGNTWLHVVEGENLPAPGDSVVLRVDAPRRNAIQRHHTVTHLLHWALHEVASKEASQKGSFVGPDKLTFDFNSAPLTPAQVADIEKLVNERILENAGVSWTEVLHNDVKNRRDVMQFFGDKYGDTVRVVQIGGTAGQLDGYSMELCGGTHTRATGEIGLFRIIGESAIAAGVRRIEAVAGLTAYDVMKHDRELIKAVAGKVSSPIHELEKKIESLLAHQKALEKEVQIAMQRNASNAASELLPSAQTVNGIPLITHNLGDANADFLQAIADSLKGRFKGVVVLGGGSESAVTLIATVSPDFTAKVQAGKIIQAIAPIVGGKGGGKPDNARGGGKDASKLDEALAKVKSLLG